ncbi:UDP-galactose transporter [Ptychographa xylographoides]|nr:UDP-galactose transporter [Ptychographa xylographoides]
MARQKQLIPLQREPSDFSKGPPDTPAQGWRGSNGSSKTIDMSHTNGNGNLKHALEPVIVEHPAGLPQLIICVGGIYISFLSWALLQERITTTTYGPAQKRFTYAIFLNTVQSLFAALTGSLYLYFSAPRSAPVPAVFPSRRILGPLLLVAVTSSLASPFGYASLAHIDYITFILAKACKLLPVMFLHVTLFRKPYPLYKYIVVALVTAGVAVFTLYHPTSSKSSKKHSAKFADTERNNAWGLFLLSINLLLDGLTNSTQDHIFATHKPYTGPQMMVAQNILATALTTSYLLFLPILPLLPALLSSPLTSLIPPSATSELASALSFLRAHPAVLTDVLGFAACGAVGQIFIYMTLAKFSSLLLVTVTVTRKMLTMVLSVLWFGHRLGAGQWVGVGLVFGGVGAEAVVARAEKKKREERKRLGLEEEGEGKKDQ